MSLQIGQQLGSFEITSLIGKGGMGEVYRAKDTKLKRDVAIKILPDEFSRDTDRVSRFQREAESLAALNHQNIASIYDLQQSDATRFLILELVEGDTLADRIARGPLPLDESLNIARQICEALEAAHEKGIIHRDLKPANIKITSEGQVKVLDFGLAKILKPSLVEGFSNSPTMMSATGGGVILGTAAYMSPEQARGKTLDKRSDVWAFGVVLFEMLAGERVFAGDTVTDVLGAIVHKEPDWGLLPPETPAAIRRLLRRCLAKDARQRLHDIADARIEIAAASSEAPVEAAAQAPARPAPKSVWLFASIIAAGIALAAFMSGRWMSGLTSDETTLWTEILPPGKPFKDVYPAPALSPDGRTIAFNASDAAGKTLLWVRPLDSPEARALPGTEGSIESFWSPDSRSLAFSANGKLQRIDIAGGDPQFLADAPLFEGGSWASDGTILFVPTATTVYRISASGGAPKEVTRLNAARHELIHGWPSFLPDGKNFLLWVFSSERQNEGVYVGALDSGELRPLLPFRTRAQYANGYLFFGRQGSLVAQPFDPDKLQLSSEPKRVASGLGRSWGELANLAFSVSDSSSIVWSEHVFFSKSQPTWFDRMGHPAGTIGEAGVYFGVMPSPDGKYAATEFVDSVAQTVDILLFDTAGGNPARLTFVNYWAGNPIWSPDSQRVLFTQWRDYLNVISVHGGGAEQAPFPGGINSDFPMGWSPDGQSLLLQRSSPATRSDLWILPMSGDRKPRPYLTTPVDEFDGRISPDGRWVAYATDESGRDEVFAQSFPVPGNKKRISVGGGTSPMWRRDGRELYFVSEDHALMAVSVTVAGASLEFSAPTRLFIMDKDIRVADGGRATYAPSPDGQRFLVLVPVEIDRPEGVHLIHNWHPEPGK